MKKKATLKTAVILIALIITGILIAAISLDLLGKEKDVVDDTIDITGERTDLPTKEEEVNKELEGYLDDFANLLETSKGEVCLRSYQKFPKEIKDHKLFFARLDDNTFMQLFNKKRQLVFDATIPKIPCVINATNFYDNCIKGTDCKNQNNIIEVEVEIKNKNIFFNGEEAELKDQNLMFQFDDQHICFIPTRDGPAFGWFSGCTAYENALNDKCINEIKKRLSNC